MSEPIVVDDAAIYATIRAQVAKALERPDLDLELAKIVIPTISLNAVGLTFEYWEEIIAATATLVLPEGHYIVMCTDDGDPPLTTTFAVADLHFEHFVRANWVNVPLLYDEDNEHRYELYSDGENVRVANADAVNDFTLIGVRAYQA